MKNVSLFLALIYIFTSSPSYAEIYNPESVKEIKDMVEEIFEKRNPQKVLFIFPIEQFILRSTHPAIQKQDQNYTSLLKKAFSKVDNSKTLYINPLILTQYPNELGDKELPDLINYIQKNKSLLIITTSNVTGGINNIDALEVWTYNYLKNKKIDLAEGVFANTHFTFNKELKKVGGTFPSFYQGLLSYNSSTEDNSAIQVLSTFLATKLKKLPDVIVMVSSNKIFLEALEKQLKILRNDNEFFGILYILPPLATKEISPEDYLQFWQDFVRKLNQVKRKQVDIKSENPYEE
jgi:hypothetical protein